MFLIESQLPLHQRFDLYLSLISQKSCFPCCVTGGDTLFTQRANGRPPDGHFVTRRTFCARDILKDRAWEGAGGQKSLVTVRLCLGTAFCHQPVHTHISTLTHTLRSHLPVPLPGHHLPEEQVKKHWLCTSF